MLRPNRCLLICLVSLSLVQVAFGSSAVLRSQSFPIAFEANRGQVPERFRYVFHRDGLDARFSSKGADFVLANSAGRANTVHMSFVGGHTEPWAEKATGGHANYFIGSDPSRWLHNVPLYSALNYSDLYRGISLTFYGNGQELEHDFTVSPGIDPSQIAFEFGDASRVTLANNGDLVVRSGDDSLRIKKPVAYQIGAAGRDPVDATFIVAKDGTVRFGVGRYDRSRSLVIDPIFVFATYLGGTGTDVITGITTDTSGNILVTGYTSSTDFPTQNPEQAVIGGRKTNDYGCQNAFITKLDSTGKTLIYSTYLGGSYQDYGGAITVDPSGNAIVAGTTLSTDFPQAGALAAHTCQFNNACFFLASLKPDGSALNYSGTIGGSEGTYAPETGGALAVDASGNAYLAGITDDPQFQITSGTLSSSVQGYPNNESFVLKVDPTGELIYSTVIPGNASYDPSQVYTNVFVPSGIAADASGNVTIAGKAGLGLPTTSGVVAEQFPNGYINASNPVAGFVLKLNSTASAIKFASYIPGTDAAGALAADKSGNLWTAGMTSETTLPVTANSYQKVPSVGGLSGPSSGYILELNPNATAVLAATYLDGAGTGQTQESSSFTALALDSHSNVFVGGMTSSVDFPLLDPFVTELEYTSSIYDMVLAEMSSDLSTVKFGTFLNSTDLVYGGSTFGGMAIDPSDNLIAVGITNSRNFPTTTGSFEPQLPPPASQYSGPLHGFIAKFDLSTPAPSVCLDKFSIDFGKVNANQSTTQTLHATNCGNAALNIDSITSSDSTVFATQSCGSVAPGSTCSITLTFTPVSSNATSGTITLIDNAVTIPQVISFTGQGIAPAIAVASNPFSFGHILVGTQGPSTSLLVSNQGQATLVVSNISISGAGFSIASNNCAQVSADYSSCIVDVSFAPAVAGTSSGSLVISSNDPVNPRLTLALTGVGDSAYSVPVVSSIGTGTILIGSGPTTITVTGNNFYPQSVVQLNGAALSTSFMDNSHLQTTIPGSSITTLGELPLTVVNPAPGGGTSNAMVVTPYQTLLIAPSSLVSVPATGLLYAAVPASASANPNTVIPIDPTTGSIGNPIAVGNNPGLLAASTDGAYLYVANQGDETVQRINLKSGTVERTFPYTPNLYCSSCSNLDATDMATIPGSPQEVLLSQGSWLTLYNDAGSVNYVPNDGICCRADPNFGSIALAGNPLTIYGLPFSFLGDYFQVAELTSSGLQYTRPTGVSSGPNNATGNQVISDGAFLYTSAGQIWDPSTQAEVGTFQLRRSTIPRIQTHTTFLSMRHWASSTRWAIRVTAMTRTQ